MFQTHGLLQHWLVVGCLLMMVQATVAQSFSLEGSEEVDISNHFHYLPTANDAFFFWPAFGELPSVKLSSELHDIPIGQRNWFLVELRNNTSPEEQLSDWVLHFSLLQTNVQYVLVDQANQITSGQTGAFLPVKERDFAPTAKGNFGQISLRAGEEARLYIGMLLEREGAQSDYRVSIRSSVNYFHSRDRSQLLNGIFIGFMLLMLVYNFFLYLQFQDRTFLYYSAYLFFLLLFVLYNTGILADVLHSWVFIPHPEYIFFFKLSSYAGIFAYLVFLRKFLELEQLLPAWNKYFSSLAWFGLPLLLVDAYLMYTTNFNYASADVFTLGYAVLFLIIGFSFLVPLWRQKTGGKKRFFIIGGVVAMGIGILWTVIQRIQYVEYSSLYFRLGTALEVIIFSLGLAYRQRENQREQQQAVFELEKATILQEKKEQEAIQLAELDEAKSRFYTQITHEFRTPLTVIMGVTNHLYDPAWLSDVPPEKKQDLKHSLSLVQRNSKQLLQQVNQLLDLAKLESGALVLNNIQADIIRFLEYLTESFHSLAEDKQLRLLFYPEERELIMDYDETKLQHVIYNLLSNAVKFSQPGGKIVLHAKREQIGVESFLELKVSDSGAGISAEEIAKIFDRFYQVNPEQQEHAGTGVGLTLTKELVELMQGEIQVESESGKGTVFTVRLPISQLAPKVEPAHGLANSNTVVLGALPIEEAAEQWLPEEHPEEDAPILLLVEDNKDIVLYLRKLLAPSYQLEVAVNGKEGIERATTLIPDLILSDVMMPEIDGLELTRVLKADERTSHIPIVLLTAKASEADMLVGLRQGADAYLLKPFNKEELFLRLDNLLKLRRALQTRFAERMDSSEETEATTKEIPQEMSVDELFLKKLSMMVMEQISDPGFTQQELAQAVGLSPSQLYRKLKGLLALTPSHYIRNIRLKHATQLLKDPALNISEVAYECGFNDPNYFSRTFHKVYGKPPSQFRE